ncbi:hypothetical protein niasHT_003517 [Heterodera trifolii]|uniref:G protein-coupled receptor n=1 Tax=Heterodera trifolii TaxID=157864 RepID=A0ABD2M2I9_9BILA
MEFSLPSSDLLLLLITNVNAAFCALIGIALNVLSVCLAVNGTPKASRPFLPIVLHSAILGTLLLIVTFLLQPCFLSIDGIPLLKYRNVLMLFPRWLNEFVANFWLFLLLFFATSSICVQFAYRFLLLKSGVNSDENVQNIMPTYAEKATLIAFGFALSLPLLFADAIVSLRFPFLLAFPRFCAVILHWLLVLLPLITVCSLLLHPPITFFAVRSPNIHLINPILPAYGIQHKIRRYSEQFVPTFTTNCTLNNEKRSDWQRVDQLSKINHRPVFSRSVRISPVSRPAQLAPQPNPIRVISTD